MERHYRNLYCNDFSTIFSIKGFKVDLGIMQNEFLTISNTFIIGFIAYWRLLSQLIPFRYYKLIKWLTTYIPFKSKNILCPMNDSWKEWSIWNRTRSGTRNDFSVGSILPALTKNNTQPERNVFFRYWVCGKYLYEVALGEWVSRTK